jgi:CubicO group peptidase (beta-lactamase class C family)
MNWRAVALLLLISAPAGFGALDPAAVRAAAEYSASRRGAALLIVENGRTVHEQYLDGGGAGTARRIYSGTKAFWSLAALTAAQEGSQLDERVAETIPSWRYDPRKIARHDPAAPRFLRDSNPHITCTARSRRS